MTDVSASHHLFPGFSFSLDGGCQHLSGLAMKLLVIQKRPDDGKLCGEAGEAIYIAAP
jgi:hypothetical protein